MRLGGVGIYHKVTYMCATKQYKEVSKTYLTNTKSLLCEQLSCYQAKLVGGGEGGGGGGGGGGVNSK